MLEEFLPLVTKPARYINTEINAVHKDLSAVKTKICLFFPDTYEVGMSHLGLRILYDILNKRPDTACERVFSPWTDYEEKLRASGRPLASLESNLPLAKFDILGISLQYELSYTNVLVGLELAQIPLRADERTDEHPIVIAGGPCSVNPEPLADFIDVFFIGEAEESIHELIDLRQEHRGRREFLEALAKLSGFWVPALGGSGVRRRFLKNIDAAPFPDKPLVPLLKPVHDRVTVEVARGCIRGCRFCQAGIIYRPFRERSADRVRDILQQSLACTGYEELSLASLSSGDYSAIEPLIVELLDTYRDSRVSVSLPSLRVGTLTPRMIEAIASTRKTGFTFAPEAGTERLRRVINKPVSDRDLLEAASTAFANGWSVLKVYFMIGLPTETDEDLDGIIRLANELLACGKRATKRHVQINVSVSTFVPKPHTPFQWIGQAPIEEIGRKQAYLRKGLGKRGINLKLHHSQTSLLEAAFARGDRSLGQVIEKAVGLGCRFDGWTECFDFAKWQQAFAACGKDAAACAMRSFSLEEALPWDHVHTGVTKKFLQQEYERARTAEITDNCRTECMHCGIGCADGGTPSLGIPASTSSGYRQSRKQGKELAAGAAVRIRLKFSKTGRIRFLSHLDFMTLFHRAIVRAGIPIAYSQGFNPHPKIAFGPALSVGMESESEYLDMDTDPFIDKDNLVRDLNRSLPEGVRILEARLVARNAPSLSGSISRYEYRIGVPADKTAGLQERVAGLLAKTAVAVERDGKSKDIRPCIEAMTVTRAGLEVALRDVDQIKPRVQDVISACFEIGAEQTLHFGIIRTAMYYRNKGTWQNPMET